MLQSNAPQNMHQVFHTVTTTITVRVNGQVVSTPILSTMHAAQGVVCCSLGVCSLSPCLLVVFKEPGYSCN